MSYRFFLLTFAILPFAGCTYLPFASREASVTCSYNQRTYQVGESFPSIDQCNSCGCSETGEVACTLKACATGPVATCETSQDCQANAIDTSFCAEGSWSCVQGQCELACDISNKL